MRTIEVKLYSFDELSEEAKKKAIERLFDLNVDWEWWEYFYEDAENVGLKITSFDLDRGTIKGNFKGSAVDTAEAILRDHGKDCETYKTAKEFLSDLDSLTGQYDDIEDCPEDDIEKLENDFLISLLEDYRILLDKEFEYQTSREAIIETIQANKYEFTEDGELS